jgi:hypothetical protein
LHYDHLGSISSLTRGLNCNWQPFHTSCEASSSSLPRMRLEKRYNGMISLHHTCARNELHFIPIVMGLNLGYDKRTQFFGSKLQKYMSKTFAFIDWSLLYKHWISWNATACLKLTYHLKFWCFLFICIHRLYRHRYNLNARKMSSLWEEKDVKIKFPALFKSGIFSDIFGVKNDVLL